MSHIKSIRPIALSLFTLLVISGCSPAADAPPAFDGTRAYDMLKKQVDFGPRYPGAPGHDLMVEYMQAQLKPYADGVSVQEFARGVRNKRLVLHNIIAHFNPSAKKWVLLAAHWDSRPTADQEVNLLKQKTPIPGANDGASGVAALLELARVFAKQKPDVGVFIVLFDGEDYGPGESDMYLGAKYFAANLDTGAVVNGKQVKFEYGILLDMIGDKNLNIYQETASLKAAPDIVKKVWSAADKLGYKDVFIPEAKYSITDDHIPLIKAGIKCINVIDFDYGPWHTLDDTVDKCSPKSLKTVGDVISRVIYQEKSS
ncbi:MAG: M28 family peptidase [Armatimonadetes bacterium]|nr:M28 family peptidase [Armatimonadota bacterium]